MAEDAARRAQDGPQGFEAPATTLERPGQSARQQGIGAGSRRQLERRIQDQPQRRKRTSGHSVSSTTAGREPKSFGRAFAIGIVLNLGYVFIEGGYGVISNSMALVADAGHNLSDVLGLAIASGAAIASKRLPTKCFTYPSRQRPWDSSSMAATPQFETRRPRHDGST